MVSDRPKPSAFEPYAGELIIDPALTSDMAEKAGAPPSSRAPTKQAALPSPVMECQLSEGIEVTGAELPALSGESCKYLLRNPRLLWGDFRPLVAKLRSALQSSADSRLVLIVPDRNRCLLAPTVEDTSFQLREWSLEELCNYFASSGFQINHRGWTGPSPDSLTHTYLELACSPSFYQEFLRKTPLAPLTGVSRPQIALEQQVDSTDLLIRLASGARAKASDAPALLASHLLPKNAINSLPPEDFAWKTVEQVLFFAPDLAMVSYTDAGALGIRIAQAKKSGLLPKSTVVRALAQGPVDYRERQSKEWLGLSTLQQSIKERLSIELADVVDFAAPSDRAAYETLGYRIPSGPSDGQEAIDRKPDLSVIVPVYKTDLRLISDLCWGLNVQTLPAREVIFVNDGSGAEYDSALRSHLEGRLQRPWKVVTLEQNRGLAGARNAGLSACRTKYLVNLDSDDVPLPNFLQDIVTCLAKNPDATVALGYFKAFKDGTDWRHVPEPADYFRPLGDGIVLALRMNLLGHANAGFVTERLRALGGWDDTDRSMWEDWACYLKILCSGGRIAIIPRVGFLCRFRADSMLRTYDEYPAMLRLARNTACLPLYEALRLQSVIRDADRCHSERTRLTSLVSSRSVRVALRLREWLNKMPRLRRLLLGITRNTD